MVLQFYILYSKQQIFWNLNKCILQFGQIHFEKRSALRVRLPYYDGADSALLDRRQRRVFIREAQHHTCHSVLRQLVQLTEQGYL